MPTFRELFLELTGHAPFPWQERLFSEFVEGEFRNSCDVPTGLGKTSVIAIWLLALAHKISAAPYLRRQPQDSSRSGDARGRNVCREALATKKELEGVAGALRSLGTGFSEIPLSISTPRGQFADNAECRTDPARPAVIVGTVDMIGSRLLFAGYGCGFKSRPLPTGFLGQDPDRIVKSIQSAGCLSTRHRAIAFDPVEQRTCCRPPIVGVVRRLARRARGPARFEPWRAWELRKRLIAKRFVLMLAQVIERLRHGIDLIVVRRGGKTDLVHKVPAPRRLIG